MDQVNITEFLIRGLQTLPLSEEDITVILAILDNEENERRMVGRLVNLGREPSLEELLTIAESIRKY